MDVVAAARTPDAHPWNARMHDAARRSDDQRSSFEVDRDRIIHSATFRELQYKTQVQGLLSPDPSATFRTRLNHVIEVAQIARGVARLVDADEALAEAIALAHDLGHPPFGHAGEKALRGALRRHGREGWNANVHSLEVVDRVEAAFMHFRGLDLTYAVREGIARHSTPFDEPVSFGEFVGTPNGGIECQVVDVADVFAYLSHDLDDALAGGYIALGDLGNLPEMVDIVGYADSSWESGPRVWPDDERGTLIRKRVIAILIYRLINGTAVQTADLVERAGASATAVRASVERVVKPKPEHERLVRGLLGLLTERYYRSSRVSETDEAAMQIVDGLFEKLMVTPDLIPERFRSEDEVVSAATYVASLNDLSADALARQLGLS